MVGRRNVVSVFLASAAAGLLLSWPCGPGPILAQQAPKDPSALALIRKALQYIGGGDVCDVTIEAQVTYTAGSDIESGTASLQALGSRQSRVLLNLDGGQRQDLFGSSPVWTN